MARFSNCFFFSSPLREGTSSSLYTEKPLYLSGVLYFEMYLKCTFCCECVFLAVQLTKLEMLMWPVYGCLCVWSTVQVITNLVKMVKARDIRRPFCPAGHWLSEEVNIRADKVKCQSSVLHGDALSDLTWYWNETPLMKSPDHVHRGRSLKSTKLLLLQRRSLVSLKSTVESISK